MPKKFRFKRAVAMFLGLLLMFSVVTINTADTAEAAVQKGLSDLSREAAGEGAVLLRNPDFGTGGAANAINKVLPIRNGQTVSIFGRVQDYYYAGGTGSGEAPRNRPYTVSIADGLRNNPNVNVNETLAGIYADYTKTHPFIENGGWIGNQSWGQDEMPLTDDIVSAAKTVSDAAVIIIGRTAGEDDELAAVKGSYYLTDAELDMIGKVYAQFDRVVVVMNVSQPLDMRWMDDYPNAAVLYAWQGGMEGGNAVADVLTGDITPSGKLTDTIIRNLADSPAYLNSTAAAWQSLNYQEDIYVGYRYFETFAPNKVMFPFGYGLSYTTFDITTNGVSESGGKITADVTVNNTGVMKGKEVVQVYYGAPQGLLGKPVKQLAAFAKTGVLLPGQSQQMTLTFNVSDMASYDDAGKTGNKSCYVLEAGDYKVYIGGNVRDSAEKFTYNIPATTVTVRDEEAMAATSDFTRMKPFANGDGTFSVGYEPVPKRTVDPVARTLSRLPAALPRTTAKPYKLIDVYNGAATMDQFVGQFTDYDLAALTIGESGDGMRVTTGTAGCFGAVTQSLADMGIPLMDASDGPAGIRASVAVTSAIPTGTTLGCTWNVDLLESLYQYFGKELNINNIDTILGPGVEIHRYQLGGRNFEYFSEDPLVSGMMAAAAARGIESQGPSPTIKHCCANNKEYNRGEVNCNVSERALREIYLKSYEIAIKSGNVRTIMTSYNPVNGTWNSSDYDLTTIIMRDEWGFSGIFMTDWWAHLSEDQGFYTGVGNNANGKAMVRAQHDLYMRANDGAAESNLNGMNTLSALQNGSLTVGELQRVAKNICTYAMKSQAFARLNNIPYVPVYAPGPDWFGVTKQDAGESPLLTGITIGGKAIRADVFDPLRLEYKAFYSGTGDYPIVDATAAAGTTVTVSQATAALPGAYITARSGDQQRVYRVLFQTADGLPPLLDNPVYAYLGGISVNGVPLSDFDAAKFTYGVGLMSQDTLPAVTYTPNPGVTATMTTDAAARTVSIHCVSADQSNTYALQFGQLPQSDDFNTAMLSPFWNVNTERPGNYETPNNWSLTANPGHLRIIAEVGDFWQGDSNLKNFFQQPAYGDWVATAKIDMKEAPGQSYKGCGIVVSQDNNNYLYLKYECSGSRIMGLFKEVNGADPIQIGTLSGVALQNLFGEDRTIYLRMKKIGDTYTAYASPDGVNYYSFGTTGAVYDTPLFGFCCSSGSVAPATQFYADFDYIHFDYNPTVPTVNFGNANTTIKVADTAVEPIAMSTYLKPAACGDSDGGLCYTGSRAGEYVTYNVNVAQTGTYRLAARYQATNSNPLAQMGFSVYDESSALATFSYIQSTDGWVTSTSSSAIPLTAGAHQVKVAFSTEGIDLNWLEFMLAQDNVDTTALAQAISAAEAIGLSQYTMMKANAFRAALAAAHAVLNDPVNADNVAAAVTALAAAVTALNSSVLPVNVPPDKTIAIPGGIRILPVDTPWSYAKDGNYQFRGDGSNNWTQPNDVLYLGRIDLTNLAEIRVNYSNGNGETHTMRISFYTEADDLGTPTKRQISGDGRQYDVYYGGDLQLSGEAARITFTQANGHWETYGMCSTDGVKMPDTNAEMVSYDTANCFVDNNVATGFKNLYMRSEGYAINVGWVDLIYNTPSDRKLPVDILPTKTSPVAGGIRILPFDTVWSYVGSNNFHFNSDGSNDWTSPNDTTYLGLIDLTNLYEICVGYSNGNTGTVNIGFYTEANEYADPALRTTGGDGQPYPVYSGGNLVLTKQAAQISFNQLNGHWENYGECSTSGVKTATTNPEMDAYLGGGANYIDHSLATGMKNLYMRSEGYALNVKWVDLIYAPKTFTITKTFSASSLAAAAGGSLNAEVVISNPVDAKTVTVNIIAALYNKSGALSDLQTRSVELLLGAEQKVDMVTSIPAVTAGMRYKLFVWDAASWVPLTDATAIE